MDMHPTTLQIQSYEPTSNPILCPVCMQMLAACSNPALVMQQQMAFERQDSRVKPVTRLPRNDKGYSRGLLADSSKPRKSGWKALF
jgi:hypothetical protein